ncbi:hypothetical protein K492DRAFT_154264 [Lichtheimia hyalospora FSU 10163]|nr:hypothetical protein K492DRAFT_154264 [Lichtheimia hyalospora FSU 10163]
MQRIALIENKVKQNELPPIRSATNNKQTLAHATVDERGHAMSQGEANAAATLPEGSGTLSASVKTRHIHVWSAGGDGTVMSVVNMLEEYGIDLDLVFFSCIPFGTGNDFSQVLGWGRTTKKNDVVGANLNEMERLICDRLEQAEAARLDVFRVILEAHESGHVRKADSDDKQQRCVTRNMGNYMSIGVQGYVGSGFEQHRTNKRFLNILVYTIESSKWVFWRKFPPINRFIDSIVDNNGQQILEVPYDTSQDRNQEDGAVSTLNGSAIDLVIQNIPHIWGREVDLWSEATTGLESVTNRHGSTDPTNWTPQLANDGKLEMIALGNMYSYIKKLLNVRQHVSRVGQFKTPFEIIFRKPSNHHQRKMAGCLDFARRNRYERKNIMGVMCDGEFFLIKDPKTIRFEHNARIWTLGRDSEDGKQGRLVQDEKFSAGKR